MDILTVLSLLFTVPAGLTLVYWIVVGVRVRQLLRDRPTVRTGLALSEPNGGWPMLSVIVPAHNEESEIERCVRSLREQAYPNLEMIFVLDRCTDGTKNILERHAAKDDRIIIIENDSCPDDWAGKCNAARLGSEQARGQFMLFTDADTQFDPELCRASVALAAHHDLGLLSLLSTLTYEQRHERIAQPVASVTLVRLFPFKRLGSDKKTRPFANGQFMLFQRQWYEQLGGHHGVKDDLLEDLAFARLLKAEGGEYATVLADGMLWCTMYDSMRAFCEGWKRIFIEACRRHPSRLRKNAWRIFTSGIVLPALQVIGLALAIVIGVTGDWPLAVTLGGLVVLGWAVQFLVLLRVYRASGAPVRSILWYPIGCWVVGRVMLKGANDLEARRPVRWGGREYVVEPR